MGQAVCNRAELGVRFPAILFRRILEGPHYNATLAHLDEFDPEAARGVRNVKVGRCKLDPGLKAPLFSNFDCEKDVTVLST